MSLRILNDEVSGSQTRDCGTSTARVGILSFEDGILADEGPNYLKPAGRYSLYLATIGVTPFGAAHWAHSNCPG